MSDKEFFNGVTHHELERRHYEVRRERPVGPIWLTRPEWINRHAVRAYEIQKRNELRAKLRLIRDVFAAARRGA